MKVVLIPASPERVGVGVHVLNLASLLHDAGLLDVVICPGEGWLTEQLEDERLPFTTLAISFKPAQFISSNIRLFRYLKSRPSASVVHVHGRFPLFVSSLSMVLSENLAFVSTVHQFSDSEGSGLENQKTGIETFLLKRLRRICCVSEALRVQVITRLGEDHRAKIDYIPNWIRPVESRQGDVDRMTVDDNRHASKKHIKICTVGRLVRDKGFDVLIEAMAVLHQRGFEASCHIFGAGLDEEHLANLIGERGLSGIVELKGRCSDIQRTLPAYDLLVIPSRSESFSLVALEGFNAGLPIIASDIPGLNETVLADTTGLLFEKENVEALVDCIMRVTASDDLARALILNGNKFLQDYIPSEQLLAKFIRFYKEAYEKN
ncbi:MAG TPA: glycosyltransferase family 4 protein [Candidatus Aquicultor sp.]|jgi:glycosyltransferase involved in cell wall biosynthesis